MPKKDYEEKKEAGLLHFGESYTSLVLGMIVVIISTVLLLAFVHNKNSNKTSSPDAQPTAKMSSDFIATDSPKVASPTVKPIASPTLVVVMVTKAQKPTPTLTPKPTLVKVKAASPAPSATSKPAAAMVKKTITPTPAKTDAKVAADKKGAYVVKQGDTLWAIAEKEYKSGYNWVDIARVNKLSNPDAIEVGSKLTLPKVQSQVTTVTKVVAKATVMTPDEQNNKTSRKVELNKAAMKQAPSQTQKITGSIYTVVRGDNLWTISVRAYGDGYQWVKIAKANKLVNPNVIHRGNKFIIPRSK